MAKAKPTSLDALRRLQTERQTLDEREAELRRNAAIEIGSIALACGAELLDAARLKAVFRNVMRIGIDDALALLESHKPAPARPSS